MNRFFSLCISLLLVVPALAMQELGNITEDASLTFYWNTFDDDGASVTRATNGTVKVRRSDGTDCTAGAVTDTEDTPATGIHECTVNTSVSANFATGYDYVVWVDGMVVAGDTINAILARFSIQKRYTGAKLENVAHGGAAATLTLLSAAITNTNGSALTLTSSGGNGSGLTLAGNGTGHGLSSTGGATGNGLTCIGGATSGDGITVAGPKDGFGIAISGTQGGIVATATAGPGIEAEGTTYGFQATASAGPGIGAIATGGNNDGIYASGFGSGHGIYTLGGATGNGLYTVGGATSGSGIVAAATTLGSGISASGAGTGNGLLLNGGATGNGLRAIGGNTTGHGIYATAATAGDGVCARGAGVGGYDINANIQGNLSGSVGTLTTWDKAGYTLSATGADLILKSSTFGLAMADAVWEEGVRTITAGAGLDAAATAAAVWNAATATYGTADTYGSLVEYALDTNLASRLASAGYTAPPTAAAVSAQVAIDLAAAHGAGSWLSGAGLDAAGIRAAVGLAAANLDAQLADIPTVAEFEARSLAASGYAPAATALSTATWTGARAGYIDTILKIVGGR